MTVHIKIEVKIHMLLLRHFDAEVRLFLQWNRNPEADFLL